MGKPPEEDILDWIDIDLNSTDQSIIHHIYECGHANAAIIALSVEKSQQYIRRRMKRMTEHNVLYEVSPGLYDLPVQAKRYLPTSEFDYYSYTGR
ncbi:hypothetical protein DVK00_02785 [Haloarcula sp. Atlit-47R]|uniref:hypothetical protein n=1 Tax=Haloarcula sp. Atlit-47R TaxID=2282132 RepID=UPI000EF219C5|nr:hypothetical protein [Haloarcula sp. Atlit-47R]RLM47450.1 hypothetical protein DVK00_02785 [Haloarcula sp. Atlit-47R]